jgi:rubrerythrin
MERWVNSDDVKELLKGLDSLPWDEEVDDMVDRLPTMGIIHGEWIKESMGMRKNINTGEFVEKFYCTCPVCGYRTGNQGTRFNFCPECGTDMRKKVQE